jgi:hypothetical protein
MPLIKLKECSLQERNRPRRELVRTAGLSAALHEKTRTSKAKTASQPTPKVRLLDISHR